MQAGALGHQDQEPNDWMHWDICIVQSLLKPLVAAIYAATRGFITGGRTINLS